MFDIGFSELLLFGVIALIVLGPEKLPQAARTAGQWYAKIRRTVSTLQSEIEAEFDLAETRQQMQQELAKIRQTEADMKREIAEMRGSMRQFEYAQNHSEELNDDGTHVESSASTSASRQNTPKTKIINTRPWENMWFRLSAYDEARRLPAAPYLPNYQADILLNASIDDSSAIEFVIEPKNHLQKTATSSPIAKGDL